MDTDTEIGFLIKVADAGVKERRSHWYTFGIPIDHNYDLNDQLEAIRKMGISRNRKALDYLKRLEESDSQELLSGGSTTDLTLTRYPNARGELGDVLDCYGGWGAGSPGYGNHPDHNRVLGIIQDSIFSLEKSIRHSPVDNTNAEGEKK